MPTPSLIQSSSRGLGVALLVLAFAVLPACNKRKEPSPEYQKAISLYGKLYGEKLDDAYLDPRMNDVEALLQKVPADSLDGPAAAAKLQDIRSSRDRVEKERAEREKNVADATTPVTDPFAGRAPPERPQKPPEPEEEKPDAGAPAPGPGMSMAEVDRRWGSCIRQGDSILVEGHGQRPTYELKDIANCRDRLPSMVDAILLVEDGKVLAVAPRSRVRQVNALPDGGVPPNGPPDAGSR